MCDHENREAAMVTVAEKDGRPTVWCDPCLTPLVKALNEGGVATLASCCGHGTHIGSIALADGRWLVVMTAEDWAGFDNQRGTGAEAGVDAAAKRPWEIEYGHLDAWADTPEKVRNVLSAARVSVEAAREARP